MIMAIGHEITLQHQFNKGMTISSIYLGGGTPSLLNFEELEILFKALRSFFIWENDIEITLEANPDDINPEQCRLWKKVGINRLSIGIQSFRDRHLTFMRRAHNSEEAKKSIFTAQDFGFENLSCDLIFGIPDSTSEEVEQDLAFFAEAKIPHISAYALTMEEKTIWHKLVRTGKGLLPDEVKMEEQFYHVMHCLNQRGYEQYEISNYALPGFEAIHNTRYWLGDTYLGLGPSAHSYDGHRRRWNVANNALYLAAVEQGIIPYEEETLTEEDVYNEMVMVGLRTKWGVDFQSLQKMGHLYFNYFTDKIVSWEHQEMVIFQNETWVLTDQGKIFADAIASDLFLAD